MINVSSRLQRIRPNERARLRDLLLNTFQS